LFDFDKCGRGQAECKIKDVNVFLPKLMSNKREGGSVKKNE
jgi:hypothetical protein